MAKAFIWDWRESIPRYCPDFQCNLRSLGSCASFLTYKMGITELSYFKHCGDNMQKDVIKGL